MPTGAACRLQAVQRGQALYSGMPEPPEVAQRRGHRRALAAEVYRPRTEQPAGRVVRSYRPPSHRPGTLTNLDGKPLIVITAGRGQQAGWSAAQDQLARLSTNSLQRTVSGADHTALLYNEAMSANSSQAIRDVLSAIRTGTPLRA